MLSRTLTLAGLIAAYKSDPDSPYLKKIRYATRMNYLSQLDRIELEHGHVAIEEIQARMLLRWHENWKGDGNHVAMSHSLVGMLRTLATFGSTYLESIECRTLKVILHDMRFEMPKPRTDILTSAQVMAIRRKAHDRGWHSIALAQSLQCSCTFRQKDVIGEWVPLSEPGAAIVTSDGMKWLRGVHWGEVNHDLILKHITSKRNKAVEIDLKLAPMVVEELRHAPEAQIRTRGPMVICELTGEPYRAHQYRRMWRMVADDAGVPKHVYSMDTRAGAITEALGLGARLDAVRKTATHSNAGMTQRYSRGDADEIAEVMKLRALRHVEISTEEAA